MSEPTQPLIHGFDLGALRLSQTFGESLGVKRLVTRVPVRKPPKTAFFRVHPGEDWRLPTMILELKEEGETYIVAPAVRDLLPELQRAAVLHTAIDRQDNVFLIPVPLPGPDGRRNPWHDSLASVVSTAEHKWVRATANLGIGAYDLHVARGSLPEPVWPDMGFAELVQIAFRNRVIDSADHPVVRQMEGIS